MKSTNCKEFPVKCKSFSCPENKENEFEHQAGYPCSVFLEADGMGYDDLGCYRQKEIKIPDMYNLIWKGILFSMIMYSQWSDKEATHISNRSGRKSYHLRRHRVLHNN